ncbi:MAG: T9SS type A sorting domain-containing protein, partial [Bacteroidales bacterium]|nr:T9SS type A sorting domain-containing protein [Bacteroidales bacterium]
FVESDYDKYVYQTAEINLGTITSIYAKNTDEFNIYPNPSTGTINILPNNSELSTVNYAVSNMLGQVLLEGTLSNGENAIHISGLQNGYYYLSIETNNSWYTRKIVLLR